MKEILQELWNDSKYLLQRNKPPKPSPPIPPVEIGSGKIHVYIDPDKGLKIDIIFSDFLPDHIKPYMDNPTIQMLRDLAYHSWLKRVEYKKTLNGYDKHVPYKMRMFDFEIDW